MALVQFDIFNLLLKGPKTLEELAETCKVPQDRMTILLRAAVALKLLRSNGRALCFEQNQRSFARSPGPK